MLIEIGTRVRAALSEDVIDLPLAFFDHLLLVPGVAQLFCHFVPLESFKLGFSCRLGQIFLNEPFTGCEVVLSVLLAPAHNMPHLVVQCLLDLRIDLFVAFTFFDGPRLGLYGPERGRILDNRVFSLFLVFLISFHHLLLPYLTILSLNLAFLLSVSFQFVIVLFDLILKFLLLTDKIVDFSGEAFFYDQILVVLLTV